MTQGPRTIDLTPTWTVIVRLGMRLLEDSSVPEAAKKLMREEFMRLAKFADDTNARVRGGSAQDPRALFNRRRR